MARKQHLHVGKRELVVSNLDKVFFPESSFTKGGVIAFYTEIGEAILPHLRDRPLTLKRYPDGVAGEHFYEKNAPKHTPSWVKTFAVPRTEGDGDINYVLCNDLATLIWATNLADIEKHVLLARAPDLARPTAVVFDLDPGEPAGLIECAEAALRLKKFFETWSLQSFVKVSGSKGLHLSVPLNRDAPYEATQPFAKAVAELMARENPKGVVAEMAKNLRGGKVFIDWSQNSDFKTTVCVYSMRAKGRAPLVSVPITWEELRRVVKKKNSQALSFTPDATLKRIQQVGDLFAPVLKLKQTLPAAFLKALAAGPPAKLSRWPRNTKKSNDGRDKSLREYTAKRHPKHTPEPMPAKSAEYRKGPHRFVIQKHAASHLHYDFRLEMQGVLRSWAVPKGPPMKLRESRLAMHVEDHPLEYEKFEGTIAPGNYGAGTVMVWDFGFYGDISGNEAAAFHSGKMHLVLQGHKLKGEWILVKDSRDPESNKWLFIKAGESMKPLSVKVDDTSAISKRSMGQIAKANDAQWQSNRAVLTSSQKLSRSKSKQVKPRFVAPMQCKPVTVLPKESNWTYEIKFDGYRALAVKADSGVKLFSRNENLLNARFQGIIAALDELPGNFAIDGEIVALDDNGRPSFQLLQNNQSRSVPTHFYAFDLLNYEGRDLLRVPIEERRAALDQLMSTASEPLRRSALLEGSGSDVLDALRKLGLEGVVGKRASSIYESGDRSGAWIKHRTDRAQEFVVGGYIPATDGFDALLVGLYEDNRLEYVAKVRNGFVPRIRNEIFPRLEKLRVSECPFANLPQKKSSRWGEAITAEKMKECRWVKAKLVVEVAFLEWTAGNHLRHCKFVALRDDKKAREVVRET